MYRSTIVPSLKGRHCSSEQMLSVLVLLFFYYKVESLIQTIVVSSVFHSGEPGLLVSKITARTPFSGYAGDLQQSEKKKLHNVFEKGDMFFNTGDLLSIDADNFIYFQDRVGDTFR